MKNKYAGKGESPKIESKQRKKSKVETIPNRKVEAGIVPNMKVKVERVHTRETKLEPEEETDSSLSKNKTKSSRGDIGSDKALAKPASTSPTSAMAAISHQLLNEGLDPAPDNGNKLLGRFYVDIIPPNVENAKESKPLSHIPKWFPQKITRILKDERCPEVLPFKSIGRLTHYRAWLEQLRYRRWKRYIAAGKRRYQLVELLRKFRRRGTTTQAIFQYRLRQHNMWKAKALAAMEDLDKFVNGIKILDKIISVVFANEREVYEEDLDRKK